MFSSLQLITAIDPEILFVYDSVQSLIAEEEKLGISRNRIVIGGFSQGGAVALYSAIALNKNSPPLGGILAFSTWMPLHQQIPAVTFIKFHVTCV